MASQLISAAQSLLFPELVSRVGAQTGESDASISKAFGGVIPLLLAALSNQSENRGVMGQVAALASRTPSEPSGFLRNVEEGAPLPPSADPTMAASSWISSLFSRGTSGLSEAVARYAGIKSSSAAAVVAIAAPIVLASIGRLMRSENLDANRLGDRLKTERQTLASAVPSALEALLPSFTRLQGRARPEPRASRPEGGPSAAAWAMPVVLGLALLAGTLWWLDRHHDAGRVGTTGRAATTPVGTVGSTELFTRRLPGNFAVRVPRGGMEDRLVDYLSTPSVSALNREFDFDRIAFNTGSATLTEPSREQIANIAAILRAYPTAHVSVDGYTDNVGDESANLDLSRARATSVMDALRDMGVPSNRMQVEAYGSRNPEADNATEQGRARNRRVVLQVTSH